MGFLSWLGLDGPTPQPSPAVVSPWSSHPDLLPAIVAEAFGIDADVAVSAVDADRIPSVARAKSVLVATIAPLPLRELDRNGAVGESPTWTYRSNTPVSPFARMAMTVIDGFYHGDCLWAAQRGTNDTLLDAAWVPRDRWRVNQAGAIVVDNKIVKNPLDVIYFDWPGWSGLVNAGARTIRGAAAVEAAWVSRAKNPVPLTVIRHQSATGNGLEQPQIDSLLAQWSKARKNPDGALGYLPPELTLDTHGEADAALYENARNAIRLDIANFAALPASLLDGSQAEASLTYVTTEGQRSRLLTETVPYWAGPIEQRLSQDDIVPRGRRIRFDLSELINTPPTSTGAPAED